MARGKKTEISSQLRRDWLEKSETGTSVFKISVEYERDPRTVKHHIERALREREAKEARVIVIRDALLKHHAKLISYAEKLYNSVNSEEPASTELLEDRMYFALKSHLPRSPLWNYLNRLNRLYGELNELKARLRTKLRKVVEKDAEMPTEESVRQGLLEVFLFQVTAWAKGHKGISLKDDFKVDDVGNEKSSVEYGSFHLGIVADSEISRIEKIIEAWEKRLVKLSEYHDAKEIFEQLNSLKMQTQEELAVIFERGIVPGSCKYCPA
jgi:hypothetical protein